MKTQYSIFQNQIRKSLTVTMSPSMEGARAARAEFEQVTGSDDTYAHRDIWDEIYLKYSKVWSHENMSLKQAQTIHEADRIANPDRCVSISTDDNCFIGNTTWNDQMLMFWEYETYTDDGAKLAEVRKAHCDSIGKIVAWE